MGRGGFNGGSATVSGPKADLPYIFTSPAPVFVGHSEAPFEVADLKRACIVASGEQLTNELGGKQGEFGYLLYIPETTVEQDIKHSKIKRRVFALLQSGRAHYKYTVRWISASNLLDGTPEGRELVLRYHLDHPERAQPWGFERYTSGTIKDSV